MTDERTPQTAPRSDEVPEWEVFVREAATDPLRHAGSVSAPSADVAREQAATLLGDDAHTLWLCPAAEVHRFTTRTLGEP
jgi:rSAM-partnered protein